MRLAPCRTHLRPAPRETLPTHVLYNTVVHAVVSSCRDRKYTDGRNWRFRRTDGPYAVHGARIEGWHKWAGIGFVNVMPLLWPWPQLTQRGRGEHLFWIHSFTHNPHHLILDSVIDPKG